MIKTKGVVLRTLKYRESSLIIDIFTEELGLRSYIVNGVRKSKSKQSASILQPMSHLNLVVYDNKEAEKLNRIKEYKLGRYYEQLPFDVLRSLMGQFMIEVIRKCIRDHEVNKELYRFIEDWFRFLDRTENKLSNLLVCFLIQLAGKLGFSIDDQSAENLEYFDLQEGRFTHDCPPHKYFLSSELSSVLFSLIKTMKENVHLINFENSLRSSLLDRLILFYQLHVEGFGELKTLEVLRDIMR